MIFDEIILQISRYLIDKTTLRHILGIREIKPIKCLRNEMDGLLGSSRIADASEKKGSC